MLQRRYEAKVLREKGRFRPCFSRTKSHRRLTANHRAEILSSGAARESEPGGCGWSQTAAPRITDGALNTAAAGMPTFRPSAIEL